MARDMVRTVDVTEIDEDRPLHHRLQTLEVERAELLPFGDDHQRRA